MSESKSKPKRRLWTKRILFGGVALALVPWALQTSFNAQTIRADEGQATVRIQQSQAQSSTQVSGSQHRRIVPVQTTRFDPATGRTVFETTYREVESHALSQHEMRSRELAAKLQQLRGVAHQAEREKLLEELKTELEADFTLRHERQAKEIAAAQQRLDSVKELLDKRTELKAEIVRRRMNQLIGKPDLLDWDTGPVPTVPLTTQQRVQHRAVPLYGAADFFRPSTTPAIGASRIGTPSVTNRSLPASSVSPVPRDQQSSTQRIANSTVRVDSGSRNDVFAIVRRLITARIAAQELSQELERIHALHKKGLVTESEMSAIRAKAQRVQAEKGLAEAELESLTKRLQRESEFAAASLKRTESLQRQAKARFESGTGAIDAVLQAEGAAASSQRQLAELEESKKQLQQALKLIDANDNGDPTYREDDPDPELDSPGA